jgi:hypothetical protein
MEKQTRKQSNAKTQAAKPADEMTNEEFARHRNTMLKFWRRFCAQPRCQRVKSCVGANPAACFDRCWAMVPESEKWWIRAAIKARAADLGVEAAMKQANDMMTRYLKDQAEQERKVLAAAAPATPQVALEQAASEPPIPHARRL